MCDEAIGGILPGFLIGRGQPSPPRPATIKSNDVTKNTKTTTGLPVRPALALLATGAAVALAVHLAAATAAILAQLIPVVLAIAAATAATCWAGLRHLYRNHCAWLPDPAPATLRRPSMLCKCGRPLELDQAAPRAIEAPSSPVLTGRILPPARPRELEAAPAVVYSRPGPVTDDAAVIRQTHADIFARAARAVIHPDWAQPGSRVAATLTEHWQWLNDGGI